MTIPSSSTTPACPAAFAWWTFDSDKLVATKTERGLRVSVCLPARNEEDTIASIVTPIRERLVDELGLVDELVVLDDGSGDRTAAVAESAGARVVASADVLPSAGPGQGKGNVIWKSLAASDGDIICWVDADIRRFDPHFVTGLLGPLLCYPEIQFAKGHYRRPLKGEPTGGGRVTELMARPLLSRFFPELAGFIQPLAGEYAGTRALLERIPIVQGWGVEVGLLIDIVAEVGLGGVAQVNLGVREHRNRPLHELSPQAMAILLTTLRRAGLEGDNQQGCELLRLDGDAGIVGQMVEVVERPPMCTMADYRASPRASANNHSVSPDDVAPAPTPAHM
jgi:glucosyl-3-phosphoglycerate synthase